MSNQVSAFLNKGSSCGIACSVRRGKWTLLTAALLLVLQACATAVFEPQSNQLSLTPDEVRADPDSAEGLVIWGGVIVSATNLADRTQLEVLAYPLDGQQRPLTRRKSLGRFLLQSPDYLETEDYTPGRAVTAIGNLQGLVKGEVGQATYHFPTLTISDVHLWRIDNSLVAPRFIFGIGVNVSS